MTPEAVAASTATRWQESEMNLFSEESWPSFQAHSHPVPETPLLFNYR